MEIFEDELECLKSSFNSSEFQFIISNKTPVLKFILQNNVSVTFEILPQYPEKPPVISVSTTELINAERFVFENELRNLADKSVGCPMIMDLVIKLQQLTEDYYKKKQSESQMKNSNAETQIGETPYFAVILIDHMRQKKKYCNMLISWATELGILGCLLFYHKWIFLLLQGSKKQIKEFTMRHRTVCIDVDSAGKPCKEKMAKTLFEGYNSVNFPDFSMKEMSSLNDVEIFLENSNVTNIYKDIIQPLLVKNKSSQ